MIDFNKIKKECKRLKIYSNNYYNPLNVNFDLFSWILQLSERAIGKTTAWLLFGMVCYKMENTRIEYCRLHSDMIKRKNIEHLFDTIKENNYISKIFDDKYNDIYMFGGFGYLCYRDNETGKIVSKDTMPFIHFLALNENYILKSSYTSPNGDLLILDEFIDNKYSYNDYFVNFCDIISTIFRHREYCKIIMLSNTINCNSQWFKELTIDKIILKMHKGEKKVIETKLGTHIQIEILANNNSIRQKINNVYFGFENSKLNAITGADTWAIMQFPVFDKSKEHEFFETVYLKDTNGNYLQVKICNHEIYNYCLFVRRWDIIPASCNDIFVVGTTTEKNEINIKECAGLYKYLLHMINTKKCYFRDNLSGLYFMEFLEKI